MRTMFPYGNRYYPVEIPDENLLAMAETKDPLGVNDLKSAVRTAIDNPISAKDLSKIVRPGDTVAIVVNDITRPFITDKILPPVLEKLYEVGARDKDITIVIATGVHRANSIKEQRRMLGKIVDRIKVINHDARDEKGLTNLGVTKRGIPVRINKIVAESKVKILTGLISPHQQAGYSGGRKSVLPGIASYDAIKIFHTFPICPRDVVVGKIEGNLTHEEALEAAGIARIDFIVNVVLNSKDEIFKVVAGDLHAAWLEGVQTWRKMLEIEISEYADIAIVSPGGYPRDINFWQSQKAIASAELIVKKGGIIILVAQCADGLGEEELGWFKWLTQASTPREVIERFKKEGYVNGSDKAYSFARALQDYKVMVVNESIQEKLLREMFFEKYGSLEDALAKALSEIGKQATIVALPRAVECLPTVLGSK